MVALDYYCLKIRYKRKKVNNNNNKTMNANHKKFMLESNKIEGENRINPGDLEALEMMIMQDISEATVLLVHSLLGQYLGKDWVGKYRTCEVTVGSYRPPFSYQVQDAMNTYFKESPYMNSWQAHNKFEKIHPFRDLNGRVGRLIWLNKAIKEGYDFSISFLQKYYYQTLKNQNE